MQTYEIVPEELYRLKIQWLGKFRDILIPVMRNKVSVTLTDEEIIHLVSYWACSFREYDQGIAWGHKPVDEKKEHHINGRLLYWSSVWDTARVQMIHDIAYTGFQHPTEEQCQHAESAAAILQESFGVFT